MTPTAVGTVVAGRTTPYVGLAVKDVPAVLRRLKRIQTFAERHEVLGPHDGVACFNRLYHTITETVYDGIGKRRFHDPRFISALDVAFANRYFSALRASATAAEPVPVAWGLLIDSRDDEHINPIQFAAAGVNAHVNLDLAVAVVEACSRLRSEPASGSKHDDYNEINAIFAEHMQALRESYEQSPLVRWLDRLTAPLLDLIDNFAVEETRALAWDHALELWEVRNHPAERGAFVDRLDREAEAAGVLLLVHEP